MSEEDDLLDNDEITPEEQAFMEGYDEEDGKSDEVFLAEDDEDQEEEKDPFMQQERTEESIMEENFGEE